MKLEHANDRFEFTPEQLEMLQKHGDEPLHVAVKETSKTYLVIEEGAIPTLDGEYIRQGLAHAAEQAQRGEEAEWDPEEIMAAGRELLAQQKRKS